MIGDNATMYFDSYDCASFVIRGLNKLYGYNATLLPDVHLNYTRLNLYSYEPEYLGTYEQIMQNQTLHTDFVKFYEDFQAKKPNAEDWILSALEIYETFYLQRRFYFYFNEVYWYLKLKEAKPLEISFDEIPISAALSLKNI